MKQLGTYNYWIFDLDGTLTRPIFDFPKIKARLGLPTDRGILEVLSEMPPHEAQPIHEALEQIEYEMAGKAEAAPGALQLLEKLHARGIPLGILTRNMKHHAIHTLEVTGMAPFFQRDDILGREEAAHKPDPDGILHLLKRWQAPAREAIMVGDFLFDLQAAHGAGLECVYVDSSGQFPHRHAADYVIQSLEELHEHL